MPLPMSMTITHSAKTLPCVRKRVGAAGVTAADLADVDAAVEKADE